MISKTLEMTLLFDFFGDLLTEKQRECFDLYYNEDLSLAEIARNMHITRQGVRDFLQRAEHTLVETEEKTGLIRRFRENQAVIQKAAEAATEIAAISSNNRITKLAGQIMCDLETLKD